jgi:hypothetical protein
METFKNTLGPKHPDAPMSMASFAYTLRSQGRDKEAITLMARVKRLGNEILGSDHPFTSISTQVLHEWQMPLETSLLSHLLSLLPSFHRPWVGWRWKKTLKFDVWQSFVSQPKKGHQNRRPFLGLFKRGAGEL